LNVKGDHFHEEAMINLKFGKALYITFIMMKMKVMSKGNDLDLVTRSKSGDGSMIPQKEASSMQEMCRKEGAKQLRRTGS